MRKRICIERRTMHIKWTNEHYSHTLKKGMNNRSSGNEWTNEWMNEAKLSSLLTSNVEPNEIAVIYEKSQVLNTVVVACPGQNIIRSKIDIISTLWSSRYDAGLKVRISKTGRASYLLFLMVIFPFSMLLSIINSKNGFWILIVTLAHFGILTKEFKIPFY